MVSCKSTLCPAQTDKARNTAHPNLIHIERYRNARTHARAGEGHWPTFENGSEDNRLDTATKLPVAGGLERKTLPQRSKMMYTGYNLSYWKRKKGFTKIRDLA
jgi:hypothetical protein